jgi:hypothetical protein
MRKYILLLTIAVFNFIELSAQNVVSVTYSGEKTKQELTTLFGLPLIKYGARYYVVKYTSTDAKGQADTLSGLLAVPNAPGYAFARLIYQHGTADCKTCVPSSYGKEGGAEGQVGLLLGGLGFIAMLPDYVGMGSGRGFQTYVHAKTLESATMDMVRALEPWLKNNNLPYNEQIFITGYSQGGYASMVFHKYLESASNPDYQVTAAAHLSGPYSLSGVMRDVIIGNTAYEYPAYIPNTILGFQEAYGDLYSSMNEVFKPEYIDDINKYYNGELSITGLNDRLYQKLISLTGAAVGKRMLQDDFLEKFIQDPASRANVILKENDVFDWAPKAPTRIFYCKADDQVPYLNSTIAHAAMQARGATMLVTSDLNSGADHGQCYVPAMTSTIFFFLSLQKISVSTTETTAAPVLNISPNPVTDATLASGFTPFSEVWISDLHGRIMEQAVATEFGQVVIYAQTWEPGIYLVSGKDRDGKSATIKMVKL